MKCAHKTVKIFYWLAANGSRLQPAEYSEIALCVECGEEIDTADIPGDSEIVAIVRL